jgi:hypothetical protein
MSEREWHQRKIVAWTLADLVTIAKSPCTEKCGIADHKLVTGGGLLLMADISPVMSASIPARFALAASDVEGVSRD